MPTRKKTVSKGPAKVRYAVVGLGYFSQTAILPAFANAGKNSRVSALISDDPAKLKKLARKYGVEKTYGYDDFDKCLAAGEIDAVLIALPNDLHKEYAVRAAKAGVHVLCEKPMAVTERECEEMIRTANEHHVKLMIAYRLHFEAATLKAIETIRAGRIGDPRFIHTAFSMQVKEGNIRVKADKGGGSMYDLGIYCINAARYLFQDEPYEVVAFSSAKDDDPRFQEVDEMTSAILRFPGERMASITSSFGASDFALCSVVGTKGELRLDPAFDYAFPIKLDITVDGKTKSKEFPKKDQVAAEIVYFSDCVLTGKEPEPSGVEGLADIRIIRAIHESSRAGKPVAIERVEKRKRPTGKMEINLPPVKKPELFHADKPTQD